jgi:hypothetical protein
MIKRFFKFVKTFDEDWSKFFREIFSGQFAWERAPPHPAWNPFAPKGLGRNSKVLQRLYK